MNTEEETLLIPTGVAHAYSHDHGFRGHRVFADLLGDMSLSGMLVLSLSGRRLSRKECEFIDELAVITTMADPRIWPLKISRIIGAYGRFVPAVAAGFLSIDGADVGPWVCERISGLLRDLFERVEGRVDDLDAIGEWLRESLAVAPRLMGFGVPFRSPDERVKALDERVRTHGREHGPYWRLFESLADVVRRERKIEPNIDMALTAALLDLGIDPGVIAPLTTMLFQMTFVANAMEAALQPAPALRALPIGRVDYVGRPARESPRALARHEPP
jgi:Citrate synthase, C-terminal domain